MSQNFLIYAVLFLLFVFPQYKYQVSIDGTVAAYRFPYLLLGDSLVIKQASPYYEHFYVELEPWRHYVPVKRTLVDLLEKIKWAKVIIIAAGEKLICRHTIIFSLVHSSRYSIMSLKQTRV